VTSPSGGFRAVTAVAGGENPPAHRVAEPRRQAPRLKGGIPLSVAQAGGSGSVGRPKPAWRRQSFTKTPMRSPRHRMSRAATLAAGRQCPAWALVEARVAIACDGFPLAGARSMAPLPW